MSLIYEFIENPVAGGRNLWIVSDGHFHQVVTDDGETVGNAPTLPLAYSLAQSWIRKQQKTATR